MAKIKAAKNKKRQKSNPVKIPFEVKGEYIYIKNKQYTFNSLFIMTFLVEFVAVAAIGVSIANIIINGFGSGVLYLILAVLLFAWGQVYEKILRDTRKITGRKTFIKKAIDKIWS